MKKVIHVKQLDRSTVRFLLGWIIQDLQSLSEGLGVVIYLGDLTLGQNKSWFQLKITALDFNGDPLTEEMESFYRNAVCYGFTRSDLDKEFIYKGQAYKICGWSCKSHKYPVIARSRDGKKYNFTFRTVFEAFGQDIPF